MRIELTVDGEGRAVFNCAKRAWRAILDAIDEGARVCSIVTFTGNPTEGWTMTGHAEFGG